MKNMHTDSFSYHTPFNLIFTTGLVNVPDYRLDKLAIINNSEKVVNAVMEFVDIAGIVKGASGMHAIH